jgi:hypothetical protein
MTTKSTYRSKARKAEAVVKTNGHEVLPTVEPHEETALEVFVEHQRKAITEAAKAIESLVPEGFRDHSRSAVKEVLEAYRELINSTLDDIIAAFEKAKIEPEEMPLEEEVKEPVI